MSTCVTVETTQEQQGDNSTITTVVPLLQESKGSQTNQQQPKEEEEAEMKMKPVVSPTATLVVQLSQQHQQVQNYHHQQQQQQQQQLSLLKKLNRRKKMLYMCKRGKIAPLRYRRNFAHLLVHLVIPSVEIIQLEILQHQRERLSQLHSKTTNELKEIFVSNNVKRVVLDFGNKTTVSSSTVTNSSSSDQSSLLREDTCTPNSANTELQYTAEAIPAEIIDDPKITTSSKLMRPALVLQGDDIIAEVKSFVYSSSSTSSCTLYPSNVLAKPMTDEKKSAFMSRRTNALKLMHNRQRKQREQQQQQKQREELQQEGQKLLNNV